MNERNQLEEALRAAPDAVNEHWYTADEFGDLGFSPALIPAMKDTENNRAVAAFIKDQLLMTCVRTKGARTVRLFCRRAIILRT